MALYSLWMNLIIDITQSCGAAWSSPSHTSVWLDEAAIAAEKNLKSLYNSQRDPIPGTIKPKGAIP